MILRNIAFQVLLATIGLLFQLPDLQAASRIYWTEANPGAIKRANLDGSGVELLLAQAPPDFKVSSTRGIVLDEVNKKMYFVDQGGGFGAGRIRRANLDGSDLQDVITGLSLPSTIAIDASGSKIYWVETGLSPNKIQRANLDGTNVQDVVTTGFPRGIALDIGASQIYWTDPVNNRIQRANLDGTGITNVVLGLVDPMGIALDLASGNVYWTDAGSLKIQRANLNGSGVQDLVTGLSLPQDVTLDLMGGKMYWTDLGSGKIQRAGLDGSAVEVLVAGVSSPFGITFEVGIPELACTGFKAPFDEPLALKKKVNRAIPLKIQLTDGEGFVVTDQSITAAPVVNVLFNGQMFGTVPPDDSELLPPGAANEGNMFRFDAVSNHWIYNLGTKQFEAAGTYEVTVASGDNSEYALNAPNPACRQTFERLP